MRQLPIEDGSHLYRIKCVGENVERVAKEADLISPGLRSMIHANWELPVRWGRSQMSVVLSQFMSPLAIMRVRFIVAVTPTILAFALVALVVLAGWSG
jgi:hypothetical protein